MHRLESNQVPYVLILMKYTAVLFYQSVSELVIQLVSVSANQLISQLVSQLASHFSELVRQSNIS